MAYISAAYPMREFSGAVGAPPSFIVRSTRCETGSDEFALIAGWVLLAIEAVLVVSTFVQPNVGDAA